jgi:hypothetical protein
MVSQSGMSAASSWRRLVVRLVSLAPSTPPELVLAFLADHDAELAQFLVVRR